MKTKYYLIKAEEVPTSMMERIQNEGSKPVKLTLTKKWLFFTKTVEHTHYFRFDFNIKRLSKGQEIVL